MKSIHISEIIHINENAENIPNFFNCTSMELGKNATYWLTNKKIKNFPEAVIKMIEDGRFDIVCTMAALYMSHMVEIYNQQKD